MAVTRRGAKRGNAPKTLELGYIAGQFIEFPHSKPGLYRYLEENFKYMMAIGYK